MSLQSRFAEYVQENKDCQFLASTWTVQVCCDYNDAWANYVVNGGVRPTRPHA